MVRRSPFSDAAVASIVAPLVIGLVVVTGLASPRIASADTNPQPIAVPLIGDAGIASPYPSTITIAAPSGPTHMTVPTVVLQHVTHPCPKDLAVLLVHNDTDKYLLMSHAGGCKPLAGTRVVIGSGKPVLSQTPADTTPYGAEIEIGPSNYGPQPVFPAPAPAGPYTNGLPVSVVNMNGTWKLYVMDTDAGARGVIEAGWDVQYGTKITKFMTGVDTPVPAGSVTQPGPAAQYPIEIDLSQADASLTVRRLALVLGVEHAYPDDLRILLQSPSGTDVIVMANAGGGTDLPADTYMTFIDSASALAPDAGPLNPTGSYKPGSTYGVSTLPAPAPQPPYDTAFSSFLDEPVKGIWKLWVYDAAASDGGIVHSVVLDIEVDTTPSLVIDTPVGTTTSNAPFVHVTGHFDPSPNGRAHVTWRSVVDGTYYASGVLSDVGFGALGSEVPVKRGNNVITFHAVNTNRQSIDVTRTIGVSQFKYTLSEGATGFFVTDIAVANPGPVAEQVTYTHLSENGTTTVLTSDVGAQAPLRHQLNGKVPDGGASTVVSSDLGQPLAVERTMFWSPSDYYGGHGGSAVEGPATRWLFAEGAHGFFRTYLLLVNDHPTQNATATITFLREGAGPVIATRTVPAHSRVTVESGEIPELQAGGSFGMEVTSDLPIVAERAMYFTPPGGRLFEGGHESAGVTAPAPHWFLAEGATGPFFECYILISNPLGTTADVTLTFLLSTGETIEHAITVPGQSRVTVNPEGLDARLANAAFSTRVDANVGVVVERAMYWPDFSQGWQEVHNSFGVTAPALRWAVADVRVGGPRGFQTYILLANPGSTPAEVEVRFLRPGQAPIVRSYQLLPTSRHNVLANEVTELGDGEWGAEIQVLNYQPIVVEKALYWDANGITWAGGTNVTGTRLPPR
jgi:subtilisin-like proprotein convertase family protein